MMAEIMLVICFAVVYFLLGRSLMLRVDDFLLKLARDSLRRSENGAHGVNNGGKRD